MMTMNRRDFLKVAAAGAAGISAISRGQTGDEYFRGLKVGLASYSVNKMTFDEMVALLKELGIKYVSLKDVHLKQTLSKDEIQTQVAKLKDAGITLMSCGVIYLKGDEAAFRKSFEYVKNARAPTMVMSCAAGELPLVEKLAKEFDIKCAIHNHGPGDMAWPSALEVYKAIKPLDAHIGLCVDIGHTFRQGENEVEVINTVKDRLYDFHIKDYVKDTSKPKVPGTPKIIGQGQMNVKGILKALLDIKYAGHVGLEYEKTGPNEAAELKECYAAMKKILGEL
jgi:sugar phosphate isomerase/epimerase